MIVQIKEMNETLAKEILNWQYDPPYDFYNNDCTDENIIELLNDQFKAIVDEHNQIVGFFCVGESAKVPAGYKFGVYDADLIDIGLGMNPNLVGKGFGFEFCTSIIYFIKNQFGESPIRLTVATFNKRAIHLYEKLGFFYENRFNSGFTEFITMINKSAEEKE
ncbi:GNAT family N-acetyltransferase [Rummeliibacillus pycnus]|uniref:GNAT family N-acetyltransferase n=1 Tax=Rummeliibacillus pycnus TaxID=101070 RepID=UPI003D2E97EE